MYIIGTEQTGEITMENRITIYNDDAQYTDLTINELFDLLEKQFNFNFCKPYKTLRFNHGLVISQVSE